MSGELESIVDRSGNRLTIARDGVTSTTGKKVTFERDAQDRITAVIDPSGLRVTYDYDDQGDLVAVTDRAGSTTRFAYDAALPHFLRDVVDPL